MTNDTLSPEPEAAEVPARRRRSFRLPEEIGVIVALLVMIVVIGVARPRFLNPINLLTILGNTTFEGMLSLGMVFLLAIREIDLSVGWMFNFSAVVAALMMVAGFNPWLAALAGVGFGAVLGLVNGVLAIGLGLPSIIVTLGTYSMFEGLSLVANQGRAVFPTDQSSSFFAFASMKIFRVVPVVGILFVALAIVLHIVLHRTRFGYRVQAVGRTPRRPALPGFRSRLCACKHWSSWAPSAGFQARHMSVSVAQSTRRKGQTSRSLSSRPSSLAEPPSPAVGAQSSARSLAC